MKLTIDTEAKTLVVDEASGTQTLSLYSAEAFSIVSRQWLKVGFSQKYAYRFTWLGRPVIQLPEDLVRIQEAVCLVRPDVIIETGVAHGGSLVFHASLCHALGIGRVIGIDIEIRPQNRVAIEAHPMKRYITLIEGGSTDPAVLDQVRALISPNDRVMVILDSNHSYSHVAAELRAYSELVTPGAYLLVTDGIMRDLWDNPLGRREWAEDNPAQAVQDFLGDHPEFGLDPPNWPFNESELPEDPTYFQCGWLKKLPS